MSVIESKYVGGLDDGEGSDMDEEHAGATERLFGSSDGGDDVVCSPGVRIGESDEEGDVEVPGKSSRGASLPECDDEIPDLEVDGLPAEGSVREAGGQPRPSRVGRHPRRYAIRHRRRFLPLPRGPTQAEFGEHNLSHIAREDLCEFCARSTSIGISHRKIREEDRVGEDGLPAVSMDLCFMIRRFQQTARPSVILRENLRGETRAHGLLSKETSAQQGGYVVKAVVGDSAAMGFRRAS